MLRSQHAAWQAIQSAKVVFFSEIIYTSNYIFYFCAINTSEMILNRLSILNYKNILQAEVAFSPKMNCFFGNNGMGKTNLLDAIYYLSFAKSHIHTQDSQIIHNEQDMCVLQGQYDYEGRPEEIFCAIRRKQRKQFKRNKKEYDKLSEHIGLLPLVMVSPADADLIRGGSEERRRFLDLIISQQDKSYLHALIQYNKALLQRNTLLKEQSLDASLYEVLEMQLSMYGQMIHEIRRQLVEDFTPIFNTYYQRICGATEKRGIEIPLAIGRGRFHRAVGAKSGARPHLGLYLRGHSQG